MRQERFGDGEADALACSGDDGSLFLEQARAAELWLGHQ
jgi:hypothetical protein